MVSSSGTFRWFMALSLTTTVACDQQPDRLTAPYRHGSSAPGQPQPDVSGTVVHIANVEQLYTAINDPANEGATLTLAPGVYVLSATNAAGVARPNAGRLEFQRDMSLYGVTGDRSAVVIDATGLPASSMVVPAPLTRTGPVRIGRGSNAIEWLTVLADPTAAGGIATELPGTPPTQVRIAHVISGGSSRGVDVRSVGAANAGRRVVAEIVDNEFFGPPPELIIGMSEGIRLANFSGADGGVIVDRRRPTLRISLTNFRRAVDVSPLRSAIALIQCSAASWNQMGSASRNARRLQSHHDTTANRKAAQGPPLGCTP